MYSVYINNADASWCRRSSDVGVFYSLFSLLFFSSTFSSSNYSSLLFLTLTVFSSFLPSYALAISSHSSSSALLLFPVPLTVSSSPLGAALQCMCPERHLHHRVCSRHSHVLYADGLDWSAADGECEGGAGGDTCWLYLLSSDHPEVGRKKE